MIFSAFSTLRYFRESDKQHIYHSTADSSVLFPASIADWQSSHSNPMDAKPTNNSSILFYNFMNSKTKNDK